jgi:hypothetical protein
MPASHLLFILWFIVALGVSAGIVWLVPRLAAHSSWWNRLPASTRDRVRTIANAGGPYSVKWIVMLAGAIGITFALVGVGLVRLP